MWVEAGLLGTSSPELLEAPSSALEDSSSLLARLSTLELRVVTMAVAQGKQKTSKLIDRIKIEN